MADIFLSYPSPERSFVAALAAELERLGATVFWDQKLAPGDRWREALPAALDAARLIVVIAGATHREYAADEVDRAILRARADRGVRIIPVVFDDAPQEFGLGQFHTLRARRDQPDEAAARIAELRPPAARPEVELDRHRASLLAWVHWVASWEDRVTVFASERSRPVTEVWVELAGTGTGVEPPRPGDLVLGPGNRASIEDAILSRRTGCWTIQGEPGAGKSTLLRHLTIELARRAEVALKAGEDPGPAGIPVLASLPELAGSTATPEWLATSRLKGRPLEPETEAIRAALAWAVRTGRVLHLLDSFDEVAPQHAEACRARVEEETRARPGCGFVVTSRQFGYQRPSGRFGELLLLPLDREGQRALIGRFVDAGRVDGVIERLDRSPAAQDMAGNPFLLTLIALAARDGRELPIRRVDLLRSVIGACIEGAQRDRTLPVAGAELRAAFGAMALGLLRRDGSAWPAAEVRACLPRGLQKVAVDELARATELIERAEPEVDRWRFRHRSFQEVLAAEALLSLDAPGLARELKGNVWWKPATWGAPAQIGRWAEVYANYAAMVPDAERVLDQLAAVHPRLAERATVSMDLPIEVVVRRCGGSPLALVRSLLHAGDDGHERLERIVRSPDAGALATAALFVASRGTREQAPYRWCDAPPKGEPTTFQMGDKKGRKITLITLTPFRIVSVPVTRALYAVVTGQDPAHFKESWLLPVESVTWFDAVEFCNALSTLLGRRPVYRRSGDGVELVAGADGARLPTEAEWEFSCRAGTTTRWWCGDDEPGLAEVAWYAPNANGATHPVAQKRANPWSLHDVHGNVWEWCWDWYGDHSGTSFDPVGPPRGSDRVLRGGSFWNDAGFCRSAYRGGVHPDLGSRFRGFRVVLPVPRPEGGEGLDRSS